MEPDTIIASSMWLVFPKTEDLKYGILVSYSISARSRNPRKQPWSFWCLFEEDDGSNKKLSSGFFIPRLQNLRKSFFQDLKGWRKSTSEGLFEWHGFFFILDFFHLFAFQPLDEWDAEVRKEG